MGDLPNIIANGCQRKFGTICVILRVAINGSDRTGGPVRAAKTVHADNEKPRNIKGSAIASQQWAPPVTDIGTSCESMADHHDIVSVWGELALGGVRNRNIVKNIARLKSELWDDGNLLVWYESGEGVFLL